MSRARDRKVSRWCGHPIPTRSFMIASSNSLKSARRMIDNSDISKAALRMRFQRADSPSDVDALCWLHDEEKIDEETTGEKDEETAADATPAESSETRYPPNAPSSTSTNMAVSNVESQSSSNATLTAEGDEGTPIAT
jgi:hypothetical protein